LRFDPTQENIGIEVTIDKEPKDGQWLVITNNKGDEENMKKILHNKEVGLGTFAVVQFLISFINDKLKDSGQKVKFDVCYNPVKSEFIQKLYLPKEALCDEKNMA
jgi:hypothetical protein